jgi:hydrogenase-4 component F
MWLMLLLGLPLGMALVLWAAPSERIRPWLVPLGASAYLAAAQYVAWAPLPADQVTALDGWLQVDPVGRLVLTHLSVLFCLCAWYVPGYLALRTERPNRVFCANLFLALAMMTLVVLSHHLGLMWIGMEATTLASAPLLYFNHNQRSLEATWKYLIVGSVGIALALLGSFFLAYSAIHSGLASTLLFDDLVALAPRLSPLWLHAAFVLLLVGYGAKMGLAPMHTWKPDAYGEAPGVVGALLAGGVTSCAFLAILRVHQICVASGQVPHTSGLLVGLGLFSMAVASVFLVGQRDLKRMLAYSSIEHMGVLVLGIGLGAAGVYGALLHLLNNGLSKCILFLSAGNIHRAYGSKSVDVVAGAIRRVPLSGALFLAGFLAIAGTPPFGPFLSEWTIVSAAFHTGQFWAGAALLAMLAVAFVGMGATVLSVVQGQPPSADGMPPIRDGWKTTWPLVAALGLLLMLGVYIPGPLDELLRSAAAALEATR